MRGIECVSKLKAKLPHLQVLMLTRFEQADLVFDSICAGASGYMLKNTPAPELIEAIEHIHAGGSSMTMQIARKVLNHMQQAGTHRAGLEGLAPREKEVLVLRSRGDSYKEISETLNIGMDAVRAHLHSIYRKIQTPKTP
jgi:DNA-binding NarL/FixJ family response regulator